MSAQVHGEAREALRRLAACMAKRGTIAMDIHEIRECLGDGEYVLKLMDVGALAYLYDGRCEHDRCKFAIVPKWGWRRDIIGALKAGELRWLMARYGGRDVFGDAVAWWIARAVFDYHLYDAVDLSQYDVKRGMGAAYYHIADNVWLASYTYPCARRRCFRYEIVVK